MGMEIDLFIFKHILIHLRLKRGKGVNKGDSTIQRTRNVKAIPTHAKNKLGSQAESQAGRSPRCPRAKPTL
jgi:hypothetical protein